MIRQDIIFFIGLTALTFCGSCKEVYYPDEINSPEMIPVIDGMILKDEVPFVKLSWAMRYEDQIPESISGAFVQVADDLGNIVDLEETGAGYYTAVSDDFKGVAGRTYTLQVSLPNGETYGSVPVFLKEGAAVDSLYADPGERIVYTYNAYNEPVSVTQEGLYIMADLSGEADSTLYYRFHTDVVQEITYTQDPGTLAAKTVYVWETFILDKVYSVNRTHLNNNRQWLPEHPVGYLPFEYDPFLETETATAPYTIGWVLIFKVYAVSEAVYDYYQSISDQLNASNQIFAPIPSQVKSTLRCLTDPGKSVIGVFEASSVTTIYKAFGWKDLETYESKELESFPEDLENGSTLPFPPDFWVPFY